MSQLESYLDNLQRFGIRPGLERVRALLERAGNPQNAYPIALVGGTNGKGSTCEFLARGLAGHGARRIGLFTSPHLYTWNERLRVLPGGGLFAGQIGDEALDALMEEALPVIEGVARDLDQPTEFEVMTFLGFQHFANCEVDAAIIEVGLGGHWDATNTCEPVVSVVTHVALDHCDRLGNTVEAIAADKAHIARPGRPLVTAETNPSVLRVLGDHCNDVGARLVQVRPPASADFQSVNWATAKVAGDELCRALGWEFPTTKPTVLQVPGRFETIGHRPRLIIDAANNPDGAALLATRITRAEHIPREQLILVLGILADKDYTAMTQILAPLARGVIATQSNSPRAASAAAVAAVARRHCSHVEERVPVGAALGRARELAAPTDTILITGSFTTIAEVVRPASDQI